VEGPESPEPEHTSTLPSNAIARQERDANIALEQTNASLVDRFMEISYDTTLMD
jgi:hypothetical protein